MYVSFNSHLPGLCVCAGTVFLAEHLVHILCGIRGLYFRGHHNSLVLLGGDESVSAHK